MDDFIDQKRRPEHALKQIVEQRRTLAFEVVTDQLEPQPTTCRPTAQMIFHTNESCGSYHVTPSHRNGSASSATSPPISQSMLIQSAAKPSNTNTESGRSNSLGQEAPNSTPMTISGMPREVRQLVAHIGDMLASASWRCRVR